MNRAEDQEAILEQIDEAGSRALDDPGDAGQLRARQRAQEGERARVSDVRSGAPNPPRKRGRGGRTRWRERAAPRRAFTSLTRRAKRMSCRFSIIGASVKMNENGNI